MAIIERELRFDLQELTSVKVTLRNPDLTTARHIADAINSFMGVPSARPIDPGTVSVTVPPKFQGETVAMLTDIDRHRAFTGARALPDPDNRHGMPSPQYTRCRTTPAGRPPPRVYDTPAQIRFATQELTPA